MTLSTDDEGVSRIDLTHEYVRAVETYVLGYTDLQELVRNSLEYGFSRLCPLRPNLRERCRWGREASPQPVRPSLRGAKKPSSNESSGGFAFSQAGDGSGLRPQRCAALLTW
jgi:hypothetical protein